MNNQSIKKSRKSLLRGSDNYVAQTVEISRGDDVFSFDIREIDAEAQCKIEEILDATANVLGISREMIRDAEKLGDWLGENSRRIVSEENPVTVEQFFTQRTQDIWDVGLSAGIVGWDLEDECTPENIKRLPQVFKRRLYEIIQAGSTLGVGAENFFR